MGESIEATCVERAPLELALAAAAAASDRRRRRVNAIGSDAWSMAASSLLGRRRPAAPGFAPRRASCDYRSSQAATSRPP